MTAASLGAIRWDIGGYGTATTDAAENNTLGNSDYQSRAPFYATVAGAGLSIVATQATMDQEIAFAIAGGVSYWAVLRYVTINSPPVDGGLALYQSSANRSTLKWCSMEQVGTFGSTSTYTTKVPRLITEMQQSYYFKVLTNRPLLYLYYDTVSLTNWFSGSTANLKTAIDYIRSSAISAGLATPYIVLLAQPVAASETVRVALGLDAISSYATYVPAALNATYASLSTTVQAYWGTMAGITAKIVPTIMTGWNPQPRIVRPVPWQTSQRPRVGLGRVVTPATDGEMAAHVTAAVTYVAANSTVCEANTMLAYSWNEFGEGNRPLCPTVANPTGTHLAGIAAAVA